MRLEGFERIQGRREQKKAWDAGMHTTVSSVFNQ